MKFAIFYPSTSADSCCVPGGITHALHYHLTSSLEQPVSPFKRGRACNLEKACNPPRAVRPAGQRGPEPAVCAAHAHARSPGCTAAPGPRRGAVGLQRAPSIRASILSGKGQKVNSGGLAGCTLSFTASQLCRCSVKIFRDNK